MADHLRNLGRTDLQVSPLGLGVMQFAGGAGLFQGMFDRIPSEVKTEIVRTALEGGLNWFDTAEMYGRGRSEEALAEALQACGAEDEQVIVATKWLPFLRTAANITKTIGDRLDALAPYRIDLYQVHNPHSFSPPEKEMDAMADLVEQGVIRAVGVSNFSAEQMRRAHQALAERGIPLASNQVQYHLLHREIETNGVLAAARELEVSIIAWSPLASGLLTGKFHQHPEKLENTPIFRRRQLKREIDRSREVVAALEEIAADHQVEPAQVALSWLIQARGEIVVGIPGASRVDHVRESVGALQVELTERELERLDRVSERFRNPA
jgi:aryl-alcohol dehydrogenase-like predicted oxidoreductase